MKAFFMMLLGGLLFLGILLQGCQKPVPQPVPSTSPEAIATPEETSGMYQEGDSSRAVLQTIFEAVLMDR